MVDVVLKGGLGNQMFQYAAGKALALRLGAELHLDTGRLATKQPSKCRHSEAGKPVKREYELGGFRIEPIADSGAPAGGSTRVFEEKGFYYHPEFDELKGDVRLVGFWQSYKYFEPYRHEIAGAFSFPRLASWFSRDLLASILEKDSILLHVRRGDYTSKQRRNFHGLLPVDYYNEAVSRLGQLVSQPHLFLFSDEIEWCKRRFRYDLPITFVDSNSPTSGVDDMHLMSACKHFVIANSSFSWWAAWLSPSPEKCIYAPRRWFARIDAQDLVPKSWIRGNAGLPTG